jgi:hypothetical protein
MTPVCSRGPPERRPRTRDSFGADIVEHGKDLDLKILYFVPVEDGAAGDRASRV